MNYIKRHCWHLRRAEAMRDGRTVTIHERCCWCGGERTVTRRDEDDRDPAHGRYVPKKRRSVVSKTRPKWTCQPRRARTT